MEELWKRLDQWLNNSETNTTLEKYLTLCEQLGKEPLEHQIPPELEDFPDDVQKAILTFNKLGDRLAADIGYLGKDYTTVPLHMEVSDIRDKSIFLETLLRMDERVIKKSAEAMKREREKARQATNKG